MNAHKHETPQKLNDNYLLSQILETLARKYYKSINLLKLSTLLKYFNEIGKIAIFVLLMRKFLDFSAQDQLAEVIPFIFIFSRLLYKTSS